MRKGLRQAARLSSVIRGRENSFGHLFSAKKQRRSGRGRKRQFKVAVAASKSPAVKVAVEQVTCGKPAGDGHFTYEYEHYDHLGHPRESTSRRAPAVGKDRPQLHLPNGKKPIAPNILSFE